MKRRILVLMLVMAAPLCLFSYDLADFDRVADFSVTVKTLSGLSEAEARASGLMQKLLLLDATVTSMQFIDANEESFTVELELVSGEWVGLEEVKMYSCLVRFQGRPFFRIFPRRPPRNPGPSVILPNDRILVLAKAVSQTRTENGEPLWLLAGLHARPLR